MYRIKCLYAALFLSACGSEKEPSLPPDRPGGACPSRNRRKRRFQSTWQAWRTLLPKPRS